MARSVFGGTSADWVYAKWRFGNRDLLALGAGARLELYSAKTGGTHYTDLLDENGAACTFIQVTGYQVPVFQGPDGVLDLWADDGDNTRQRMVATDVISVAAAVAAAAASAAAAAAASVAVGGHFSQDIGAFAPGATVTITHGLGTKDLIWQVVEVSTGIPQDTNFTAATIDTLVGSFPAAATLGQYRIKIIAGTVPAAPGYLAPGDLESSLDLKADVASPAFTGVPTGITKAHVGLALADNTTDLAKPLSTAAQTALGSKVAKGEIVVNVTDHGMIGDAVELTDVSVVSGTNQITSPSATFTSADIGKGIAILGAGASGGNLTSAPSGLLRTIATVIDAHNVTFTDSLAGLALFTVVGARSCAASVTRGSNTLTSADAAFTASDRGKTITVPGMTGDATPTLRSQWGVATASSTTLTLTYNGFTADDIGRYVRLTGAGASGGFHVAKITAVASAVSATMDVAAVTSSSPCDVVILGAPVDVAVKIASVTNATTVVLQRYADFTVTAATSAISGGSAVYGTDNTAALSTLVAAVPAGSTLYHPLGIYMLGTSTATFTKRLSLIGDSATSAAYHFGASSGRFIAGSDGVKFRHIGIRALSALAVATWGISVPDRYSGWVFDHVKFTNINCTLTAPGAVAITGSITTNGSGICDNVLLNDVEFTGALSSSLVINGAGMTGVRCVDLYIHDAGVDSTSVGVKLSSGARDVQVERSKINRLIGDAMDVFDSYSCEIISASHTLNGNSGLESKWGTSSNYNATSRVRIKGGTYSYNWTNGIVSGAPRSSVQDVTCIGNGAYGLKCTDGITGNLVGPRDSVYTNIEASGNDTGVNISSLATGHKFSNIVADRNSTYGVSNSGASHTFVNVSAFNNTLKGIQHGSTATGAQQTGCRTQDPNGQCYAHASATFVLLNGYGEEAAGGGSQPTLASWPVGAIITNTSDATRWLRTNTAWLSADAGASTAPQVDVFTASGTWTKPAGATTVRVVGIGGGGGAGSGRRGLAGTVRCGGGGGGGAAVTILEAPAADLTGTVTVTIGAAGTAGAAVTADDTSGNAGSTGGSTSFGAYLLAVGGGAGVGGTAALGTGGVAGFGTLNGNVGGTASTTGLVGGSATTTAGGGGAGAGGAGGGISSANAAANGGVGSASRTFSASGAAGGVVDTTAPATGTAPTAKGVPGPGSGGGAASITTVAQAGANAVGYGGGAGGGGASLNGNNSGAGGTSAPGYLLVISYF